MKEQNPQNTQLVKIHSNLNQLIKEKASALPEGFNQTRFIQNAMTVLQDTPDIESMEPHSVARTILKGAFLNLDFFNKECYAIPYNKNIAPKGSPAKYIKALQFQTDYKGEIKLVKKYGLRGIKDVYAKLVRQGDAFETGVERGQQFVRFQPMPFSDKPIVGVFAVCLYEDLTTLTEWMTVKEVNDVRDKYSKKNKKGEFSPAWRNRWGEMAKKTVLRLLCKGIQIEFKTPEATNAFKIGADANFAEFEEVQEPVQLPSAVDSNANGSSKALAQILELLHGDNVGDWLENETAYKKDGKDFPGVRNLSDLVGKQPKFVFRAVRKELVTKCKELATELYPEVAEREKHLAQITGGEIDITEMSVAVQIKVYESLFEAKLDKLTAEADEN